MQFEKPFYSLGIQSSGCGFVVCVNGAYVEFHNSMAPLVIEYPVNQWLRNGENSIDIFFRNAPNPAVSKKMLASESKITCTLFVQEFGKEEKVPLSVLTFDGETLPRIDPYKVDYENLTSVDVMCKGSTEEGIYQVGLNGITSNESGWLKVGPVSFEKGVNKALHLGQLISLQLPCPEWAFFKGEPQRRHSELSDDEWKDARKEMLVEYQKIWDIINAGDLNKLEPLIKDRCDEYDKAFYLKPGENFRDLIDSIGRAKADPEWPQKPLSLKMADIAVSFGSNITWLHGFNNPMGGVISFIHTKSNLAKKFLFFYAKINGQWKVVR